MTAAADRQKPPNRRSGPRVRKHRINRARKTPGTKKPLAEVQVLHVPHGVGVKRFSVADIRGAKGLSGGMLKVRLLNAAWHWPPAPTPPQGHASTARATTVLHVRAEWASKSRFEACHGHKGRGNPTIHQLLMEKDVCNTPRPTNRGGRQGRSLTSLVARNYPGRAHGTPALITCPTPHT